MSSESRSLVSRNLIPLSVPELVGNEWKYIKECLDTNMVSSIGIFVERFEQRVADYVGVKRGVATVNGTTALHVAMLVAGVNPDEEVLVSDLTFIAAANSIRYVGAWPVFIDAEPDYWQMDPQKIQRFLTKECRWQEGALYNRSSGRRVRAILPVHILGHPCDLDPILEIARKFNLIVMEDATESLGARYKGKMVGHLGDVACLSFNGNKLITTGGGGMLVTDNEEWAQRARYLTTQAKDDPVESIHGDVGYNYRLTNIQAAMGCAQMEQVDQYISKKRALAKRYAETFKDVPGIQPMPEAPWATSVFWLYTVLVDETQYGLNSRTLMQRLRNAGIECRPLWQPLHLSPPYRSLQTWECPVAERICRDALSLPCSVGLDPEAQTYVIETIRSLTGSGGQQAKQIPSGS